MFKKTVMAAAIAAVASGPAFAYKWKDADKDGGSTTFETNVDVGFYYESKTDSSGNDDTSVDGDGVNQLEIKAKHKINDDVTVFGEIEFEYDPVANNSDNQGEDGDVVTDDVKIGFSKKGFGTLTAGQFDSYYEDKIAENLHLYYGDKAKLTELTATNDGRHLQYKNKMGDLTFALDMSYVGSQQAGNNNSDVGYAVTALYKTGDLTLGAGYVKPGDYDVDGAAHDVDKGMGVVAAYKMGNTDFRVSYLQEESTAGVDTDLMGLGFEHSMGDVDFSLAMQQVDEDGADKKNQWAAAMQYEFYKDMHFFVEGVWLDKNLDKDDLYNVGVLYSF